MLTKTRCRLVKVVMLAVLKAARLHSQVEPMLVDQGLAATLADWVQAALTLNNLTNKIQPAMALNINTTPLACPLVRWGVF